MMIGSESMKARSKIRQDGVSLSGLIMVLAVIGVIAVLGMKILPTVTEFLAIKKAVNHAKGGTSPADIRRTFNNTATIENIESITAKDLVVVKSENGYDVHFSYERRIPLFGPAILLLAYQGTTAPNGIVVKKSDTPEESGR
jgi:hypothetical protein